MFGFPTVRFDHSAQQIVLQDYIDAVTDAEQRVGRLTRQITELIPDWPMAPVATAIQAMRGMALINAVTVVAEVGDFARFGNPRQLMAYLGLVPSEHSSGNRVRRGGITKAGNVQARRALIEGAWTYRMQARVSRKLHDRLEPLPQAQNIRDIAWKAQVRLGLMQGRVVCGRCGARMRVRYQEVEGHLEPYYQCTEAVVRRAGKLCQSVRGRPIDVAISALLVESVAPAAIEVALAVQEEIAHRIEQAEGFRRAQLERARYEAELARRRYLKVDPDNRLVADALEADWNDRLRQLDALQREHERQRAADQGLLSDEARGRILSLAKEFRRIWNDSHTAPIERKRRSPCSSKM